MSKPPWEVRNEYLGYFVRHCHLSPGDVDAIGWFDLVGLSLLADDEIDAAAQMKAQAGR